MKEAQQDNDQYRNHHGRHHRGHGNKRSCCVCHAAPAVILLAILFTHIMFMKKQLVAIEEL